MQRGDVISYIDLSVEEGFSIQRGMNFNVPGKDYSIILMSVRNDAPYNDEFINNGQTIIYEGHNVDKKFNKTNLPSNLINQEFLTPNGNLTENGKFLKAVKDYQNGNPPRKIKVYEKIKSGIWVYNGFFYLVGAKTANDGNREVFKFQLDAIDDNLSQECSNDNIKSLQIEHNRLIPTPIKVAVYARDKGKCVKCGSNKNLHYDHKLPFSKGGSSTTVDNIQLLCATCNLKKHDNIE